MFIDLSKYFECECEEKYLTYYELALFLKHSPVEDVKALYYFDSLLECILDCNNLIEDYYDEEEDNWYSGFSMPSTADLIEGLMRLYYKGGAKKILVNIPTSLLLTLADVRTQPKYRWRNIGKAKRKLFPWL